MANERISADTFRELQEVIELAKAYVGTMSHSANSVLFGARHLAGDDVDVFHQMMKAARDMEKRIYAIQAKAESIVDWKE